MTGRGRSKAALARFLRVLREASLFAACASLREPLLRWPLFTAVWVFEAPGYIAGAAANQRLGDPAFWAFTAGAYRAAMGGAFTEFFE